MTVNDIALDLDAIATFAKTGDHESAHNAEDQLFLDVLTAIACGDPGHARDLAAKAIESREIPFGRWTS